MASGDKIDIAALQPVGRLAGNGYCRVAPAMFELPRPASQIKPKWPPLKDDNAYFRFDSRLVESGFAAYARPCIIAAVQRMVGGESGLS